MTEIISLEEARALGLKRYFTGKACKRGHVSEYSVKGRGCVVCIAERGKLWRQNNPEQSAAHWKKYRDANPEKSREAAMRWQKENPEKHRENGKIRYRKARAALQALKELGIEI